MTLPQRQAASDEAPTQRLPMDRAEVVAAVRAAARYPVVVVGAGINGAGTFRDLALQGVPCLLIDKGDFGSGTSAAPSRLIHGGLKYLETGEFRLVSESARERNLLLRNAPHFVHPLQTMVPIYSWFGGLISSAGRFFGLSTAMTDRGAIVIKAGLALYDWYGRRYRTMPKHAMWSRRRALREFPDLDTAVVAGGTYYDAAVTQAERLVFELAWDGVSAGADCHALNYASAVGVGENGLRIRDEIGGEEFEIAADVVINAAGPWIDRANAAMGVNDRLIGGTKGSHLVLDNPRLTEQLAGRMVYFGSSDGRICLVYPFFGHALVGSTDIPVDDPDDARCDDAETAYMLDELQALFPSVPISEDQVVFRYAGVRPLPQSDASDPGLISRDHSIEVSEPSGRRSFPVLSLVGGKWTTFRAFAEETADHVLQRLGRARSCETGDHPIGGGAGYPGRERRKGWIDDAGQATGLPSERVATLLERYGTLAHDVAAACAAEGDDRCPALPEYARAEIRHLARTEMIGRLADLLFRRTPIAFAGQLTLAAIDEVAAEVGQALGWSAERIAAEVDDVIALARDVHGVRL